MPGLAVTELLRMLDAAFEGDDEHSLLANLRNVREVDWQSAPGEGGRTIAGIVDHAGACKYRYENYAFGDASYGWDRSPVMFDTSTGLGAAIDWAREGQRVLRDSIAPLDDAELDRPRRVNWGGELPARRIIEIVIAHDFYHAGEINHLRALLQDDDRWPSYD